MLVIRFEVVSIPATKNVQNSPIKSSYVNASPLTSLACYLWENCPLKTRASMMSLGCNGFVVSPSISFTLLSMRFLANCLKDLSFELSDFGATFSPNNWKSGDLTSSMIPAISSLMNSQMFFPSRVYEGSAPKKRRAITSEKICWKTMCKSTTITCLPSSVTVCCLSI